jgi:hypothetical protein
MVFLGFSRTAIAEEARGVLHRVSCPMVRFYVAKYTAPAAEQYARDKGATEAEIQIAKRCIKTASVR